VPIILSRILPLTKISFVVVDDLTLSVPVIFIADEPISAVWAKHFPLKV
jgi:hypothetical protein